MPYFIERQGDKHCVRKGTKESPGEVEKCHATGEAALAHLRALYVHVEDAGKSIEADKAVGVPSVDTRLYVLDAPSEIVTEILKGGPGSGWHNPPRGTHTAANAPNFRGGPGATQEQIEGARRRRREGDGEEEDDKDTVHCVCPKGGEKFVLPKGRKCAEFKCTAHNEQMVREGGKPEEESGKEPKKPRGKKSVDTPPPPTIHGEGSALGSVGQALGNGEKAEEHAPKGELPDSAFLYVESGGEKKGGVTHPKSLRHLPYRTSTGSIDMGRLRNAASRLGQPKTGKVGGESWLTEALRKRLAAKVQRLLAEHSKSINSLIAYKSDDDWRWLSISSMAIRDREAEIVSTEAYRDAIALAEKSNNRGELDLVHVVGTDVGDCDLQHVWGDLLIEGGEWHTTERATRARERVAADPDRWGVSLKFRYDPSQYEDGVYTGGIEILKRTILPKLMAASYGTTIAVTGGEKMKAIDGETKKALLDLGVEPAVIDALAEKQKSLPEEPNVVEKDKGILDKIRDLLPKGKSDPEPQPEAQQEVAEKGTEAPATTEKQTEEPSTNVEKSAEGQEPQSEYVLTKEAAQEIGQEVVKSLSPFVSGEIEKAVQPLQEKIQTLESNLTALSALTAEASKTIEEKAEELVGELPRVVVKPSQVSIGVKGADALVPATDEKSLTAQLLGDITKAVETFRGKGGDKVNI